VIEIMARDLYLDPNELLEAHSLLELGMDSMYLAHLAGMIKEEFGVEISVSRMFSFRTLSELWKFVQDGLRGM
jgi:acyl carrier protein